MKVTICLVVEIVLLLCNGCCKNYQKKCANYLFLLLLFDLFANIGTIGKIGGFEIQYVDIVWIFALLFALKSLLNNKVDARSFKKAAGFFSSICVTIIIESISPVISEDNYSRSILVSARMIMCLCVFMGMNTLWSCETKKNFSERLLSLQKGYYAIILLEIIFKYAFHSNYMNEIAKVIFGIGENQVTWLISRGGLYALQGLCKEPSHLAIMLFFVSMFDLFELDDMQSIRKYLLINIIILLISGSLAAVLYVAIILFAWANKAKLQMKWIVGASLLMVIGTILIVYLDRIPLLSYYFNRISNSIEFIKGTNMAYSSESERLKGILGSYELIKLSPLFGVGPGNNVRTCALPALISTIGVIGTFSYMTCFTGMKSCNKQRAMMICLLMALIFTMDMGIFYSAAIIAFMLYYNNEQRVSYDETKIR